MTQFNDLSGAHGEFRLLRLKNAAGLNAMDIFERGPDGRFRIKPESAASICEERIVRNKFTRRGLSAILYRCLVGHGEDNYYPPEMTYNQSVNPFQAFFIAGEQWAKDRALSFVGSITAATKTITADSGTPFTTADIGRWLYMDAQAGSGWGNMGVRKIVSLPGGTSPNASCVTDGVYAADAAAGTTLFSTHGGVYYVTHPGDAKVLWDESDGQFDSKIPAGTGVADNWVQRTEGRRVTLITSDTGNPFRRAAISWIGSNPYRELEILLYATAQTCLRTISPDITDSITPSGSLALIQLMNAAFTISDEGRILKISDASNAVNCRQAQIVKYVDGQHVYVESQDTMRHLGITQSPFISETGAFMSVANQDGVWNAATRAGGDKYLDDLAIKTIGLSEGVNAGHDESANRIGVRSIVGTGPTYIGVSDRVYQHEGSSLHRYAAGELLGTYGDGYYVSETVPPDEETGYEGDKAFDGDVEAEAVDGAAVDLGGTYRSKAGSNHILGRVWSSAKDLTGYRLTFPLDTNRLYCPTDWQVWYLDKSLAPGGLAANLEPANHSHWTQLMGYTKTGQVTNIYDSGQYGYEYLLSGIPSGNCYGLKLYNMNAYGSSYAVYIAEFYLFTAMGTVTVTANNNDRLMVATDDSGTVFKRFDIGSVTATNDVSNLLTAINRQVRGYGLEAVRSNHGFLWLRGTAAGQYSKIKIGQTTTPGGTDYSPANTPLGFTARYTSTPVQKTGVTIPFVKGPCDPVAFIYRVNMSSDLPGGAA